MLLTISECLLVIIFSSNYSYNAAKVEQVKFDATSMHARPDLAAQQKMVDDGSGEAEVRNNNQTLLKT